MHPLATALLLALFARTDASLSLLPCDGFAPWTVADGEATIGGLHLDASAGLTSAAVQVDQQRAWGPVSLTGTGLCVDAVPGVFRCCADM